VYSVVKAAVTAFKTDKTGLCLGLLPRALCIQNKRHAANSQNDILQPETGQIKFQDNLTAVFIHIHKWTIFAFNASVVQLECMQQAAHLVDVPI
jgi:hypothetical protein